MTINSITKSRVFLVSYFLNLFILLITCNPVYGDVNVKYKPPLLPFFIRIDSLGNMTIGGEKSMTTFIGTFTIGADYTAYNEQGYTTVVIRNISKDYEKAYKVHKDSDELTVIADGKTSVEVKDRWVLIKVIGSTNIRFKQEKKSPMTAPPKPHNIPKVNTGDYIEFTSIWPTKRGEIDYDYSKAGYDWYYRKPPHWKITHYNGYMDFYFKGKKNFFFSALGSAIDGVSYCDVILYANGHTVTKKRLPIEWITYKISSDEFTEGENTARIELVGDSHIWIQKVWVSSKK